MIKRKDWSLRPGIGGASLESRVVLSHGGGFGGFVQPFGGGFGRGGEGGEGGEGFGFGRGGQVAVVTSQVAQAFIAFQRTYNGDVQTVLLKADSTGKVDPSANRAAFDAKVATDLATLNTSIDTAVAALPTATALEASVSAALLGTATGSTSLQSTLAAVATPTATTHSAIRAFQYNSSAAIVTAEGPILTQAATAAKPVLTPAQTAVKAVQGAVGTFARAYSTDVRTILDKADSTGTVTPSANRVAFDAQVKTDLATLNAAVDAAIAGLPSASTLKTTVDAALTGTGSTSLQSELTALTTPTSARSISALVFGFSSAADIAAADSTVVAAIDAAPAS